MNEQIHHGRGYIDRTGQIYGRLLVIAFHSKTTGSSKWVCLCECGKRTVARGCHLVHGHTKSCGCLAIESAATINKTHGLTRDNPVEHAAWENLKNRCRNPKTDKYRIYGARGIKVCRRWLRSFKYFYKDMGKKPSPDLSLERIDVNGDYCPSNCKWGTSEEQANNRRNNLFLDYNGDRLTMAQWGRKLGIKASIICDRLKSGWSVEKALSQKPKQNVTP